jgi:hypothetical protein
VPWRVTPCAPTAHPKILSRLHSLSVLPPRVLPPPGFIPPVALAPGVRVLAMQSLIDPIDGNNGGPIDGNNGDPIDGDDAAADVEECAVGAAGVVHGAGAPPATPAARDEGTRTADDATPAAHDEGNDEGDDTPAAHDGDEEGDDEGDDEGDGEDDDDTWAPLLASSGSSDWRLLVRRAPTALPALCGAGGASFECAPCR